MNGAHRRVTAAAVAATALATINPGPARAALPSASVPPATSVPATGALRPSSDSTTSDSTTSTASTASVDCLRAPAVRHRIHELLAAERGDGRTYRRGALPGPGLPVTDRPAARPGSARLPDTPAGAASSLDSCRPAASRQGSAHHHDGTRRLPGTPGGLGAHRTHGGHGTPGSAGLGDVYFPGAGNGGYDVAHYDVRLRYDAATRGVDATVTVTAQASQDLPAFNLDFRGPAITGVTVNDRAAAFQRTGQELTITPAVAPLAGENFTTVVRYSGIPGPLRQATLGTYGWVQSRDGAVVLAEPDGAPTWLPVNDHPRDKATYGFKVTVPAGLQVVANGEPGPATTGPGGATTYEWNERSPMASYLATVAIGRFTVLKGMAGRVPVITAVDTALARNAQKLHTTTINVLNWESTVFGPYPFRTAGGILDDPDLGYALETQERPVYAGFTPDAEFVVHELAHQWFGDSVSLGNWQDIWLNEGFATYAEWLWRERTKTDSAKKIFKRYYRQPAGSPIFNPPPGRPGRQSLFGFSVYIRGAMCLQALRQRVGDRAFFQIVRQWTAGHRQGTATTPQFIALSERVSGKQLDGLFRAWLHTKGKPKKW